MQFHKLIVEATATAMCCTPVAKQKRGKNEARGAKKLGLLKILCIRLVSIKNKLIAMT